MMPSAPVLPPELIREIDASGERFRAMLKQNMGMFYRREVADKWVLDYRVELTRVVRVVLRSQDQT